MLELRYGLDGQQPRTLDEVGRAFNVTRERIRQIEHQSLKKLRALADAAARPRRRLSLLVPGRRATRATDSSDRSPRAAAGCRRAPAARDAVAELAELIAIPSVSADPAHADDHRRAETGSRSASAPPEAKAEIQERGGRPLVVGRGRRLDGAGSPTVLAYAHLDVQPPDPLDLWESDP